MKVKANLITALSVALLTACTANNAKLQVPQSKLNAFPAASSEREADDNSQGQVGSSYESLQVVPQSASSAVLSSEKQQKQLGLGEAPTLTVAINKMRASDFIHLVFGQYLGLNYVMDASVESNQSVNLSLNLQDKTSQQQLYKIANELLSQNNIAAEVKDGIFFFYYQQNRSAKGAFALGIGREASDMPLEASEQIAQLVPIYYAQWQSIQEVVSTLLNVRSKWVPEQNAVLAVGSRDEISRFLKVVNAFDVPSAKSRHIGLLKLTYVNPEEFITQVQSLLSAEGLPTAEDKQGRLALSPIARRNSVIIHAASDDLIQRIKYWAKQIDVPTSGSDKRYFVYFPENARSEELGASLAQLLSLELDNEMQGSTTSMSPRSGGQNQQDGFNAGNAGGTDSSSGRQNQKGNTGSTGTSIKTRDLSMVVDYYQNALVFYATPSRYHELLPMIKQLDVLPKQVVIEATVAEVTLGDSYTQGLEWFFNNELGNARVERSYNMKNGLAFALTGVDYGVTLSLLSSDSRVNVLSNPRVVVRDGEVASINVGSQVPVISQQSSNLEGSGNTLLQTVQYRSTGVNLSVTPYINSKGVVSLLVNQSVSDATPNELSDVSSPIISNRSITTHVLAKNGQTVVLGGLISESSNDTNSGVPLLRDLPLFGNLFESKSKGSSKVELVVLITPRILSTEEEIDAVLDAFSEGMQELRIK
ncbi:secretin N-terminal domain-containing protein [Aliiglaciecola sp. CAU 1673]|uniref:secretin N-terminal domain-containing protein n=1 Tax=Aliiglaciecola sp. CAU 1673 TaxID=3032595 RepID=UPI0023D9887E|nr:secretin N-terminal domain-containing protein [Aliiglaciecola sp. CAU 1673]MDF2177517.1 secretin N-terminal domain-containing protein [Aliiglaciecola sp. CAU 1673]